MRHATPASLAAVGVGTTYDVATLDASFISVLKVSGWRRESPFFYGRVLFCFLFAHNPLFTPPPQILPAVSSLPMSRGNQRDVDRARAAARASKTGKPAKDKDGLTAAQRKERCVW